MFDEPIEPDPHLPKWIIAACIAAVAAALALDLSGYGARPQAAPEWRALRLDGSAREIGRKTCLAVEGQIVNCSWQWVDI